MLIWEFTCRSMKNVLMLSGLRITYCLWYVVSREKVALMHSLTALAYASKGWFIVSGSEPL